VSRHQKPRLGLDRLRHLLKFFRRCGDFFRCGCVGSGFHGVEEGLSATASKNFAEFIPLHPDAVAALKAIKTDNYYFWSGLSTKKSCVGDYQRAFKKLYRLAGVKNGHAHRWRDTFAVELLLKRVPVADVAVLLGHQSVKITERSYSPWVIARQEQLEATVRNTF